MCIIYVRFSRIHFNKSCNLRVFVCFQCLSHFPSVYLIPHSISLIQQCCRLARKNAMINSLPLNMGFLLWDQFCKEPFHGKHSDSREKNSRKAVADSVAGAIQKIYFRLIYIQSTHTHTTHTSHPHTYKSCAIFVLILQINVKYLYLPEIDSLAKVCYVTVSIFDHRCFNINNYHKPLQCLVIGNTYTFTNTNVYIIQMCRRIHNKTKLKLREYGHMTKKKIIFGSNTANMRYLLCPRKKT